MVKYIIIFTHNLKQSVASYCQKYMSSSNNIDARIGRKLSTTQKFHATLEIYGASKKYYAIIF